MINGNHDVHQIMQAQNRTQLLDDQTFRSRPSLRPDAPQGKEATGDSHVAMVEEWAINMH